MKAHYYLVSINDKTIKNQHDLTYSKRADEDCYWEEVTLSFYDIEDSISFPKFHDTVAIFRQVKRAGFIETEYIENFIIDKIEVTEITSTTNEADNITIKLTSEKRSLN